VTFKSGFISIVGRPNVGKSTLLNKIIGSKIAIVSDKPQTTRNRIQAIKNYPDAQAIFIDTPGIHKPLYKMNQYMLKTAMSALAGMDIILAMMDATEEPGRGDQFVIEALPNGNEKKYLVLNKTDLLKKQDIMLAISRYGEIGKFAEIFPVSALDGYNVDELERTILKNLPEGPKYFDSDRTTNLSDSFLAAEIIREKVLLATREELPYATAVAIEMWEEAANHQRIHAIIYVEKNSQKGIIIGAQGERLKKIGTEARLELEKIFASKIYLNLWVKVRPGWRDDDRLLREMGISTEE
jgi:GTP-binding protein Era